MDQDSPDPSAIDAVAVLPPQMKAALTDDDLVAQLVGNPEQLSPDMQAIVADTLGDVATDEIIQVVPVEAEQEQMGESGVVEALASQEKPLPDEAKRLLAKKWLTDHKIGGDDFFTPTTEDFFAELEIPAEIASDIALALIDTDESGLVYNNLEAFGKLDNRVAKAMIEKGLGDSVVRHKEYFPELKLDAALAQDLIKAGCAWTVFENTELFEGFAPTTELGIELLKTDANVVFGNRELFPNLIIDQTTLATLIETEQYDALINNLDMFPGFSLDQALAEQMLEQGHGWTLLPLLEKFTISDFDKLFDQAIADGDRNGYMLASNLDKFPDNMIPRAVNVLIKAGYGEALFWGDNNDSPLTKMRGVSQQDLFQMLVDADLGGFVINKKVHFTELKIDEMLRQVISAGQARDVAGNLDILSEVPADIGYALVEAGFGYQVVRSLNSFAYIDMQVVAESFIKGGSIYPVLEMPELFSDIDMVEFVNQAIDAGLGSVVLTWRQKVPDLVLDEALAKRLIRAGSATALIDHYDSFLFDHVDIEMLRDLIMSGHGEWGLAHQDFGGGHGEGGLNGLGREHADRLVADGITNAIGANLHLFKELSNDVFDALLEDNQAWRFDKSFETDIRRFPDLVLDSALAMRLIDSGYVAIALDNAEAFAGFQLSEEVARRIAATEQGYQLIAHMSNFPDLSRNDFAEMLSTPSNIGHVFNRLELFPDFRPGKRVADMMLAQEKGDLRSLLVQNLDVFEGIDRIAIGEQLQTSDAWRLVVNYYDRFPGLELGADLVNKMIKANAQGELVKLLEHFKGIDRNEVAKQIIASSQGKLVLDNIRKFPDFVLDSAVAEQFIGTYKVKELVESLDMFEGIDRADLAQRLFESIAGSGVLLENYKKFPDFKFDLAAAQEFTRKGHVGKVIYYIDAFAGVDRKAIADIVINSGNGRLVLSNAWAFGEIPRNAELAQRLLVAPEQIRETHKALVEALDTFDTDVDRAHIAETIFVTDPGLVMGNIAKFGGFHLNAQHAQTLINNGSAILLLGRPEAFEMSQPERVAVATRLEERFVGGEFDAGAETEDYIKFVNSLPASLRPRSTAMAMEMLGNFVTPESLAIIRSVMDGEMTEEVAQIGVTETGAKGLEQFKQIVADFSARVRAVELSTETIQQAINSPVLRGILKQATRYEEGQWGNHTEETLVRLLRTEIEGLYVSPMPEEYIPSPVVQVPRVANDRKVPVEWTEDVRNRYGVLASELEQVAAAFGGDSPTARPTREVIAPLIEELRGQIEAVADNLDQSLQNPNLPEKARQNNERQVKELRQLITPTSDKGRSYPLRSLANFEANFQTLGSYAALYPAMRKIMFAWALRSAGGQWRESLQRLEPEPSIAAVSTVNEYIDHIVNDQVFSNYFNDRKSLDLFKRIASVKALQDGFARAQAGLKPSTKTTAMQFVPTRGIMMELSGHIGDACWAERQDSIAKIMPNMTAVIMKQNPGDPNNERPVGAALLIETTDEQSGEPVLVIRGLNPLETTINSHDVGVFFETFVAYARSIAEARRMKLAISIDDHSGGHGTNRPGLHGYLWGIKPTLKQITVPKEGTTFNGYDISNETYLL